MFSCLCVVPVLELDLSIHLKSGCTARFVSVSPGDLGGLSIVWREGIGNYDCVLGRDHSAVAGHRDGRQHVVTCKVITILILL